MSTINVFAFSSVTCAPCKHIKPVLLDLKEDYPSYRWTFVDINNDPEGYTKYYNVSNVPSMVVVKDDTIVGTHKGTHAMGYLYLLKQASRQ